VRKLFIGATFVAMENHRTDSIPNDSSPAKSDRLLEDENTFLRDQVVVKDTQIGALLERDKETNTLIHRLQAMLAPLLVAPKQKGTPEHQTAPDEIPL
jgi:hypothetical protein